MYYVIRKGFALNLRDHPKACEHIREARAFADRRHKETGYHYRVVRLETAYVTETVGEIVASMAGDLRAAIDPDC